MVKRWWGNNHEVNTGKVIEQKILELDGYINQVYKTGQHYLILYNNSHVTLYENDKVVLNAKLSGNKLR